MIPSVIHAHVGARRHMTVQAVGVFMPQGMGVGHEYVRTVTRRTYLSSGQAGFARVGIMTMDTGNTSLRHFALHK